MTAGRRICTAASPVYSSKALRTVPTKFQQQHCEGTRRLDGQTHGFVAMNASVSPVGDNRRLTVFDYDKSPIHVFHANFGGL